MDLFYSSWEKDGSGGMQAWGREPFWGGRSWGSSKAGVVFGKFTFSHCLWAVTDQWPVHGASGVLGFGTGQEGGWQGPLSCLFHTFVL
jgi:hypothetical protein